MEPPVVPAIWMGDPKACSEEEGATTKHVAREKYFASVDVFMSDIAPAEHIITQMPMIATRRPQVTVAFLPDLEICRDRRVVRGQNLASRLTHVPRRTCKRNFAADRTRGEAVRSCVRRVAQKQRGERMRATTGFPAHARRIGVRKRRTEGN